jgi:hypothetical protein
VPEGANKASVVVSFPDGSRWLMELTPLQPTAQTQLPTLTQVASLATDSDRWVSRSEDGCDRFVASDDRERFGTDPRGECQRTER